MPTSDIPRLNASAKQDRGPDARARVRGRLAGRALPVFLALFLATPAASAGSRSAESPGGEVAPVLDPAPRAPRSGRVPRLLGPSRRSKAAPAAGIGASPTEGGGECATCAPLRSLDPADFEHPNQISGDWLPLAPGPAGVLAGAPDPAPRGPGHWPSFTSPGAAAAGGRTLAGASAVIGGWMPIVRGQQHVYQGRSNADGAMLDHFVRFTVTDLLKDIGGVPSAVVWIEDVDGGQLVESVLSFFAMDRGGDVWHTGEYAEEYELGQFVTAEASWIHGVHLARGGVLTQRRPTPGAFRELVRAPRIGQLDCGSVILVEMGREASVPGVCVPAGCFRETMTLEEWAPIEGCPEFLHRVYARGVGLIQAGAPDDEEGETLVLTQTRQLGPRELAAARDAALALDAHGLQVNEAYSFTQPVHPLPRSLTDARPAPTATGTVAGAGVSPPALHPFLRIGRDPLRAGTPIAYGLAESGPVELGVFDLAGRRVRTLVSRDESAGVHRAEWDGWDDAGHEVARGVYFARLRLGARALHRTIVLTR